MFEKVLFPTDFSDYSEAILNCIAEIPKIKEIVILHVVDATIESVHGWTHGSHIATVKLLLDEKKEFLESRGFKASVRVDVIKEGKIYEAINHAADSEDVSLIVMGAKGKSLSDVLLGSISTDMLHHATRSLLLMKFRQVGGPEGAAFEKFCPLLLSKVLIPTDFSTPAKDAVSFVKDIDGMGMLVLLHVAEKGRSDAGTELTVSDAERKLQKIKEDLAGAGYTATCHVRTGYPPDEIISAAESDDVSLIAMSPRGEGWKRELRELLVGSTTSAVARRAHRPVLVIRTLKKG
jgi:nucleotide-binding universal stress UspA family protein